MNTNHNLPPSENFTSDPERYSDDAVHEHEAPFEYKLLKGHFMPDGQTYKTDQHIRMDYLTMTDALIQKIVDGAEVVNPETGEKEQRPYDVIVYLDKSGRPLSHLVRNMWPTFAKDIRSGEVPAMPASRFVNIDREQWVSKLDKEGSGILDIDNLDDSVIRGLGSVFLTTDSKQQVMKNGLDEGVDTMPTRFDNKTILIVDETYSTGRTAKIALSMFERAFPLAEVRTTHWMKEFYRRNGIELNAVPVWYNKEKVWGRGVNDRFGDFPATENLDSSLPENYYRTFGRHFLSAPHWFAAPNLEDTRDFKYLQLINEFHQLANNRDVPLIPALSRPDREERLIAYNTGKNPYDMSEDQQDQIISALAQEKRRINQESKSKSRL